MIDIFSKVISMSMIASYVILLVLILRLVLKKSPKKFSYVLWAIVFIRLVCPFSLKSNISVVPSYDADKMTSNLHIDKLVKESKNKEIEKSNVEDLNLEVSNIQESNIEESNVEISQINTVESVEESKVELSSNEQNEVRQFNLYEIFSMIWIIICILILMYAFRSYIRLRKTISTAILVEDNIYESQRIDTPFMLGIIKPKIYIPLGLKDNSLQFDYIINHEKVHIKRKDNVIKFLYFCAVAVHWFNPLVWLSYYFLTKDMEMSCDEKVISDSKLDIKTEYAKTLFNISIRKDRLICPIAFGENSTKSRVKNVIKFKKPKIWVGIITTIVVIIASHVLVTSYKSEADRNLEIDNIISNIDNKSILVRGENGDYSTTCLLSGSDIAKIINNSKQGWKADDIHDQLDLTPSLTMYPKLGVSQIRLYKTEPLAMVMYGDKYKYYSIPEDIYEKVYELFAIPNRTIPKSKFINVISYAHEFSESINDAPTNVDEYHTFEYCHNTYYLYKRGNRYYCESPYQFMKTIPKDIYDYGVKLINGEEELDIVVTDINYKDTETGEGIINGGIERFAEEAKEKTMIIYQYGRGTPMGGDDLTDIVSETLEEWKPVDNIDMGNKLPNIILYYAGCNMRIEIFKNDKIARLYENGATRYYSITYEIYRDISIISAYLSYSISNDEMEKWIYNFDEMTGDNRKEVKDYEINQFVEDRLTTIMSSPKISSSPMDYINAHYAEYEDIKMLGGEAALNYLLEQFDIGNVGEGLKGTIITKLCRDMLGPRDNVIEENISPREWYNKLNIRTAIKLPNFHYEGDDAIEEAVYEAAIDRHESSEDGFLVVAPHIFQVQKEQDRVKVFANIICNNYTLYDEFLFADEENKALEPSVLTFSINSENEYILEEYIVAYEGIDFLASLEEMTTSITGETINGLKQKMINHYNNPTDLKALLNTNLLNHLKKYGKNKVNIKPVTSEYKSY